MNDDQDDSLSYTFPYVCKQCGNEWEMNYHDIMRLTDRHEMPCGCLWAALDFKRAVWEMMEINKVK